MTSNFNEKISRKGTHSIKWEFVLEDSKLIAANQTDPEGEKAPLLPMWVADMDFRSPPAVIEALVTRAEHGVYGYTFPTGSYYKALQNWIARRYGWAVKPDWILLTPGLLPALNMLVQTFVAPDREHFIDDRSEQITVSPGVYEKQMANFR
jgi:cystathionine beta-lyase